MTNARKLLLISFFGLLSGSLMAMPSHMLPLSTYANERVLVPDPNMYKLYWNYTETDIIVEIMSNQSIGWIMFGLTSNDSLMDGDLIFSWMNPDRSFSFKSAFIKNGVPVLRTTNNYWIFIETSNRGGCNFVKFTRKIKACNSGENYIDIIGGTALVLYGYGLKQQLDINNLNYEFNQMARKYFLPIPLLATVNRINVMSKYADLETYDFLANVTVPSDSITSYYCKMFKLPDSWMTTKRHLIRMETIIQPVQNKKYFHHMILNECTREIETDYFSKNSDLPPDFCYKSQNDKPTRWDDVTGSYCTRMSLLWQIGGDIILDFPKNVAYPLGGANADFKYFYLELHFNNANLDTNVQLTTGFRFYVTKQYEPIEFGVFTIGSYFNWAGLLIPPNTNKFQTDYYCRSDCINKLLPNTSTVPNPNNEITIIGSILHTHIIGKQTYSKVVRDGKEIEYIYNNKYYDGSAQYFNYIKPITLKAGDQVKLSCVYSSKNKNVFTVGGLGVEEEMCSDFIMYYPRNPNMVRCREKYELGQWKLFLAHLNEMGDINLEPNELDTLTLSKIPNALANARLSDTLSNKIQEFFANANRTHLCVEKNAKLTYSYNLGPLKTKEYQDQSCPVKATNSSQLCFPSTSFVQTLNDGMKQITELKYGDMVKSIDLTENKVIFSKFITYLHRDDYMLTNFIQITTKRNKSIKISDKHLIARKNKINNQIEYVFANDLRLNDLLVTNEKEVISEEIIHIRRNVQDLGVYAPLTEAGTLLVDDILVSCYANTYKHELAHFTFRIYIHLSNAYEYIIGRFNLLNNRDENLNGMNWYANFLLNSFPLSGKFLN